MRWVSNYIDGLPPERRQWAELVRHFFGRFFDSEGIAVGGEARVTFVHILALLAVPGVFFVMFLYIGYTDPRVQDNPALFERMALAHKCVLVFFSMLVIGFVALLEWEALFPDRRDYAILTPLPIRVSRIFTAKVAALFAILGLFILDLNLLTTFLYPAVAMSGRYKGTTLDFLRWMAAHGVTMVAASVFAFFLLVALQGMLIHVLSYRAFRQISVYVQACGIVALLSLFFLMPKIVDSLNAWTRHDSLFLYALPPCWFLGLYQTLLGSPEAVWGTLARISGTALAAVLAVSALTYFFGYFRHVQRTLESADNLAVERRGGHSLLTRLADRWVVRHPLERAAFYFVGKTLARSPRHRLFFAAYVGLGFALVLEGVVASLSRFGYGRLDQPRPALMSIPLVLSFFMLSGMRFIFSTPAELRANWIFRMAEPRDPRPCLAGVRKSLWAFGIAPVFGVLLPFYGVLWGWRAALWQLVFSVVLAWILVEALLLNFEKIPFTCSRLPGRTNLPVFVLGYWFVFTTYAYTMATLEHWLLAHPLGMPIFLGAAAEVLRRLRSFRRRQLAEGFSFRFEDAPDPAVQTLHLGTWAQ